MEDHPAGSAGARSHVGGDPAGIAPGRDHCTKYSRPLCRHTRVSITFPAQFMLVAAMNPCPCGFYGDATKECSCSSTLVSKYQKRISDPMLDRIDIHVDVPRIAYEKLAGDGQGETSEQIRSRVEAARDRQRERFQGTNLTCNADMGPAQVRTHCRVEGSAQISAAHVAEAVQYRPRSGTQ